MFDSVSPIHFHAESSTLHFSHGYFISAIGRLPGFNKHSPFTFLGYADAYYAFYTDSLGTGNYQKFTSVSPRSNQIGLNVAMASVKYTADRVRATIALTMATFLKAPGHLISILFRKRMPEFASIKVFGSTVDSFVHTSARKDFFQKKISPAQSHWLLTSSRIMKLVSN